MAILNLPSMTKDRISDEDGKPTLLFAKWWQTVIRNIEAGLNRDGTVKTDKVTTTSMVADSATVPWLVTGSTPVTPGTSDTEILSIAVTKEIDESLLEVHSQVNMGASDAVKLDVTYVVKQGGVDVATRTFRLEVDANNATYLPFAYENYFDGLTAGDYIVYLYAKRRGSNVSTTEGTYHMRVREFKR